MPFRQQAQVVLGAWRVAERRLVAATSGSAAERAAASDLAPMRDEYRQLTGSLAGPIVLMFT